MGSDSGTGVPVTTDTLQIPQKADDRISLLSNLDSEESLEDDSDLDLDMTLDDRQESVPLFVIFTCTLKSHLQSDSLPVKNITVCLSM